MRAWVATQRASSVGNELEHALRSRGNRHDNPRFACLPHIKPDSKPANIVLEFTLEQQRFDVLLTARARSSANRPSTKSQLVTMTFSAPRANHARAFWSVIPPPICSELGHAYGWE